MFLFRWFFRLIAIIGFVLAISICYFAFFPKETKALDSVDLAKTFNCTPKTLALNSDGKNLDIKSIDQTLASQGVEIEFGDIKKFTDSLDKITNIFGSQVVMDVSYCDKTFTNTPENEIKSFFGKHEKYYDTGTLEDFVRRINEIPFVQVRNITTSIPSMLSMENSCATPINKTTLYFFTYSPDAGNNKRSVALFKIKLKPKADPKKINNMIGNLIQTGQYFKSKYKCNG